MWVSIRNYEKLLFPALAVSLGFHLLVAFVPEGAIKFAIGPGRQPSPPARLVVVQLASENVPVYVERGPQETPEFASLIPASAPPEPRLSTLRGDSLALVHISAPEPPSALLSGIDSPASATVQIAGADSLAEITSYIASIYERISRAKYYPEVSRRLGHEGEVEVSFTVSRTGALDGETLLAAPSPYGPLNRAARISVERSGPFPPLPDCIRNIRLSLKVKIVFQLDD